MMKNYKPISLPFAIAAILLVGMLLLFSGCVSVAMGTDSVPHLLALYEDPVQWAWPQEIAVHPNGLAYIALDTGEIVVLDGPEYVTTIARPDSPEIRQNPGNIDSHLAVHPLTDLVYWTDHTGYVHVISGTTVIKTIQGVEHLPNAIAIHPDTGLIYVANAKRRGWPEYQTAPSNITVISGTRIITDLIVGYVPSQLVVNPIDGRIYVAQHLGISYFEQEFLGMLGIIEGMNVITNTTLGIGEDADLIENIAVNPNNGDMFMDWRGHIVYWDRVHEPTVMSIKYGNGWLNDIAVDAKRGLTYVSYDGTILEGVGVIKGSEVITTISIPGKPMAIAVDETHDYVYVTNYQRGELAVIRDTEVITTLSTGGWGSKAIGVDEKRGYIYVSNADSHSIAVFGFAEETTTPSSWNLFLPTIER